MATPLKHCKLCGCLTTGAVGATGLRWPFLCQPCKDREDGALAKSVALMGVLHDKGTDALGHAIGMTPDPMPLARLGPGGDYVTDIREEDC